MITKALEAKVICPEDVRQRLWQTHVVFNDKVRAVIPYLFKMKNGRLGEDCECLYRTIRNNQDATGKLEAVTLPQWNSAKPQSGKPSDEWAVRADRIRRSGQRPFAQEELLRGLPSEFRRKILEMAFQMVKGHEELLADWKSRHREWRADRAKWESAHPEFMAVLPMFADFENKDGQIRGSRLRWSLYLECLSGSPQLAAWRGGTSEITPLSEQERAELTRPADQFEEFFKKNPELGELDRLYGQYRELFRKPKGRKQHHDGFDHPPTFTLPDPVRHPQWYTFKNKASYRALDLGPKASSLEVCLPGHAESGGRGVWRTLQFRGDPRLRRLTFIGQEGRGRRKTTYRYTDPMSGRCFDADLKGIKLLFRNRQPYLMLTLSLHEQRLPKIERRQIRIPGTQGERSRPAPVDGMTTLAVDFGHRHVAAITLCHCDNGRPQQATFMPHYPHGRTGDQGAKPVGAWLPKLPGLSFDDIGAHDKHLRALVSSSFAGAAERGGVRRGRHVARGGTSFGELRDHINNMKEDQYKKAASLIVATAVRNGVRAILVENLKTYKPTLERTKTENRRRMQWAVRRVIVFAGQLAALYGIKVEDWVPPGYSSTTCSACGWPGYRYKVPRRSEWDRFYGRRAGREYVKMAILERGGPLFCCANPQCTRRRINADVNASLNLHLSYYGLFVRPSYDRRTKAYEIGDTRVADADLRAEVGRYLNGQ
ncbi:MAG: hypothetical protein AB1792_04055 [Candidatus Zixiibacteriota bacterium]